MRGTHLYHRTSVALLMGLLWTGTIASIPSRAQETTSSPNPKLQQVEFKEPLPLLGADGNLAAWGWARRALIEYNRDAIPQKLRGRIKEWEHYTVMSPTFTAGFTIARIGVLEFASVELIDYRQGTNQSAMILRAEKENRSPFPRHPYGDTTFSLGENSLSFRYADGKRRLAFRYAKSPLNPSFEGEVELTDAVEQESVAITRPFSQPGHFFYENKIFAMPATGYVMVDGKRYEFVVGQSFAIFDWGRGIWPRDSSWYWGQGAGIANGKRMGFNLGHGYGDDAKGTCNAILVDGVLHKLGHVRWEESSSADANQDHQNTKPKPASEAPQLAGENGDAQDLNPWHVYSDDGRMDLVFRPIYRQHVKQNLGVAAAELNKIHGTFTGTLVTVDGTKIPIQDFVGFLEHMTQRW
ncbi:MAG: DUF2804 domain-containing protein [Planctomycetota bacterium]